MPLQQRTIDLLRLTLTPELGPRRIARLLEHFGSADRAIAATPALLAGIPGIGKSLSTTIAEGMARSASVAEEEIALAERLGVELLPITSPRYPPLLAGIQDPPPILYVRGSAESLSSTLTLAIVGSRGCTAYGIEQAERFAGVLARSGVTIISGGARGIDSAAHRGTLRSGGRTIAVLGCGLANCYPPENEELFSRVAETGAVISELPLRTAPESKNFPARNRIISGLSLGTLVIEAGRRSGALITARLAAEDHNREVMAVPGRVDSPASMGVNDLIKAGGAHLVTEPGDVLAHLETPARHAAGGTHPDRFPSAPLEEGAPELFRPAPPAPLTDVQTSILQALEVHSTLDALSESTGLDPAAIRAEVTVLELMGRVGREGSRLVKRR